MNKQQAISPAVTNRNRVDYIIGKLNDIIARDTRNGMCFIGEEFLPCRIDEVPVDMYIEAGWDVLVEKSHWENESKTRIFGCVIFKERNEQTASN